MLWQAQRDLHIHCGSKIAIQKIHQAAAVGLARQESMVLRQITAMQHQPQPMGQTEGTSAQTHVLPQSAGIAPQPAIIDRIKVQPSAGMFLKRDGHGQNMLQALAQAGNRADTGR